MQMCIHTLYIHILSEYSCYSTQVIIILDDIVCQKLLNGSKQPNIIMYVSCTGIAEKLEVQKYIIEIDDRLKQQVPGIRTIPL